MNRTAHTAAIAALTAAALLGLTACEDTEPTGTVTGRTGGAVMTAKGATLTVTSKDGKTAVVVIPPGTYESCHMGSAYPACK